MIIKSAGIMHRILSMILSKNTKFNTLDTRRYEIFKKSISNLVKKTNLTDEEIDKEYLYIKCTFYQINPQDFNNDVTALEQEIERIETKKL